MFEKFALHTKTVATLGREIVACGLSTITVNGCNDSPFNFETISSEAVISNYSKEIYAYGIFAYYDTFQPPAKWYTFAPPFTICAKRLINITKWR